MKKGKQGPAGNGKRPTNTDGSAVVPDVPNVPEVTENPQSPDSTVASDVPVVNESPSVNDAAVNAQSQPTPANPVVPDGVNKVPVAEPAKVGGDASVPAKTAAAVAKPKTNGATNGAPAERGASKKAPSQAVTKLEAAESAKNPDVDAPIKPVAASTEGAANGAAHHGLSHAASKRPSRPLAMVKKPLKWRRTVLIILRNACFALLGRIAFGLLKLLGKKGLSRRFIRDIPGEFISLNPLKWAAVVGGFSAYRLCDHVLERIAAPLVSPQVISYIAGCTCTLPALVMDKDTRVELALYSLVRALYSVGQSHILPNLPKKMQEFSHYDIVVMCASISQIIYAILFEPRSFPPQYTRFLQKASMKDPRVLAGIAGMFRSQLAPEFLEYCDEKQLSPPPSGKEHLSTLCKLTHPQMSCNAAYLYSIGRSMVELSLPLYVPLKTATVLIFQRKELRHHPLRVVIKSIRSILCSSVFLSMCSANSHRVLCLLSTCNFRQTTVSCVAGGVATGLAAFLEPKSRRMDLALYCLMQAIRSFVATQSSRGYFPRPAPWFIFLTYMCSMGTLFYQYNEEPNLVDPKARAVFLKLLGESMNTDKSPTHPKATHRRLNNQPHSD